MVSRSNSVEVRIFGDIGDISKKLQQLEKQSSGMSQKLSTVGTSLTRNVTLPLAGLGAVATKAASDLGESVNAVTVVFGDAADKVLEFGDSSAQAVGLSKRAFLELATPLGAVFQNFGDDADTAASKTIELTQRAADMASVFNVDVTEALGAIQAALRGEADPIEKFGVSVNAAAVSAKALELGLADTASAITDADKATARYALIMEQTARVQGDFANTSDSLANKTRILKADAEDLAAEFGAALLPIMENVVGVVGDVAETFGNLSPEMQETVVQMALLAAAAGPAAKVLGGVGTAAAATATAIKGLNLLVAAQGGLIPALTALSKAGAPAAALAGAIVADQTILRKDVERTNEVFDRMEAEMLDAAEAAGKLSQEQRLAAGFVEEAARAQGRYRNEQEQQIFLTKLQVQEQEELNRVFSRFKPPGAIPPPDTSEFEGKLVRASDAVRNFAREQLALTDPLLARALAEQRAADAQERYAEVTEDAEATERDRERAALDLLVAEAELDASHKDLADTIDGRVIASLDALLERTGLLREDYRFLIDLTNDFNAALANQGLFVTRDGRALPIRDLNRELIRHGQQVIEGSG